MVNQKVDEIDPLKYIKDGGTLDFIALINDTAIPFVDVSSYLPANS